MSAASDASVLISSDNSVEAKAVAVQIHALSPRRAGRLIVLNARRLQPDVRFERFVHAHDRFASGRAADRLAGGGTLLLTHLEAMPLGAQAALFRFLDRQAMRDHQWLRVVATTDLLIHARVRSGQIREELFYRLNVIHIVLRGSVTATERQEAYEACEPGPN